MTDVQLPTAGTAPSAGAAATAGQLGLTDPAGSVRADSSLVAIELAGVTKEFRSGAEVVTAVRHLDLQIQQGEFFSLLGPSGCGKTTTMRMIAGFEEPTAGTVWLSGQDVTWTPPNKRDVNMVFQSYALFPHMSVFENVAFGLRRRQVQRTEVDRRVREMLEIVDLSGREKRRPRELSGGQQQRVALARALVNHPKALLLDEPLGALDLKLRQAMQVELKRIQRDVGITFVYVTHDQSEALTMSDRIAVMNDGAVEHLGAPRQIYEHPATRFVAGFIGTSNLLTGIVSRVIEGEAVIAFGADERVIVTVDSPQVQPGDQLEVTVRPEKIHISAQPPGTDECALRGTVAEVVYLGTATNFNVTTSTGAEVVVFVQNASAVGQESSDGIRRGDDVWLTWDKQHSYAIGG